MRLPRVRSLFLFLCIVSCVGLPYASAQKPAALPPGIVAQGEKYICQSDGVEMIYVPPGEFTSGMPADGFPGAENTLMDTGIKPTGSADFSAAQIRVVGKELFKNVFPATNVFLNGFFIDKVEVSNRRYKKFMDATKRPAPAPLPVFANSFYVAFTWPNNSWFTSPDPIYDGAEYPVSCVTWDDALAYAKWAGKTLPTELQWEKAARGTNNWVFPWGDKWNPDNANTIERGDRATRPCGTTTNDRSTYAVMDMAGNVSEWMIDAYTDLPVLPVAPSTNAVVAVSTNVVATSIVTTNALHVIKGGNWGYLGFVQSRAWVRRSNGEECGAEPGPVPHSVTVGFRCVIPAP